MIRRKQYLKKRSLRIEAIAYHNWVGSLSKKGFPVNDNGTMMDCWQLYNYWNKKVNKFPFIIHAEKR